MQMSNFSLLYALSPGMAMMMVLMVSVNDAEN
jgi:hypothetical protein